MKRPEMLYEQVVEVEERVRLVGAESNLPADTASTGSTLSLLLSSSFALFSFFHRPSLS
jgi:hypothetical protein